MQPGNPAVPGKQLFKLCVCIGN